MHSPSHRLHSPWHYWYILLDTTTSTPWQTWLKTQFHLKLRSDPLACIFSNHNHFISFRLRRCCCLFCFSPSSLLMLWNSLLLTPWFHPLPLVWLSF